MHSVTSRHGYSGAPNVPVELNLTVVSTSPSGPRVFLIRDLLSDDECDHVKAQGTAVLTGSSVGHGGTAFVSKTRTSQTGFVNRRRTPTLDLIHGRFADVLGLDDSLWNATNPGGRAEELQIVRYRPREHYAPHLDFSAGEAEQRFLTLLLYIETPEQGGYTSFPEAAAGRGLRVRPPRGSGVLFYSMLPDGNGDELSLHSGEPVIAGTKWVCNLWIWDYGADRAAAAAADSRGRAGRRGV